MRISKGLSHAHNYLQCIGCRRAQRGRGIETTAQRILGCISAHEKGMPVGNTTIQKRQNIRMVELFELVHFSQKDLLFLFLVKKDGMKYLKDYLVGGFLCCLGKIDITECVTGKWSND